MQVLKWLALAVGLTSVAGASSASGVATAPEQAVVVHFTYGSTDLSRRSGGLELRDR